MLHAVNCSILQWLVSKISHSIHDSIRPYKYFDWCGMLLIFDFVIFIDNSLRFFRFRAQGVKSLHNYRDY